MNGLTHAEMTVRVMQVTTRVDAALALPDRAQRLDALNTIYAQASQMDRRIMTEFMMHRLADVSWLAAKQ